MWVWSIISIKFRLNKLQLIKLLLEPQLESKEPKLTLNLNKLPKPKLSSPSNWLLLKKQLQRELSIKHNIFLIDQQRSVTELKLTLILLKTLLESLLKLLKMLKLTLKQLKSSQKMLRKTLLKQVLLLKLLMLLLLRLKTSYLRQSWIIKMLSLHTKMPRTSIISLLTTSKSLKLLLMLPTINLFRLKRTLQVQETMFNFQLKLMMMPLPI